MSAEKRLEELGITLPEPPAAVASYVPVVVSGNLAFVSGQVSMRPGGSLGLVGREVTQEEAVEEARWCALNILAQLKEALGSLDRVTRVVKLTVFVASDPSFQMQPAVGNGASDLMAEVFGDAGRHARSAVGMAVLPFNFPVEVEAIVEISP